VAADSKQMSKPDEKKGQQQGEWDVFRKEYKNISMNSLFFCFKTKLC
jgi:hypothetical protein